MDGAALPSLVLGSWLSDMVQIPEKMVVGWWCLAKEQKGEER